MDKKDVLRKLLTRNSGLRYSTYYQKSHGISEVEFYAIMEQLVLDGVARKKNVVAGGGQNKMYSANFDPEYYLR